MSIKGSSTKFFCNVASIPTEDREELIERLTTYRSLIDRKFQMSIESVQNGVDVSWDHVTDDLSSFLESIGETIKCYEPNESNDKGW